MVLHSRVPVDEAVVARIEEPRRRVREDRALLVGQVAVKAEVVDGAVADLLRESGLPSQPIIQGRSRAKLPGVLHVQQHSLQCVRVGSHTDNKIRRQANTRMTSSYEVISPGDHLHHSTRPGGTNGEAISMKLVERKEGVDFFVQGRAILASKAFVVHMLD